MSSRHKRGHRHLTRLSAQLLGGMGTLTKQVPPPSPLPGLCILAARVPGEAAGGLCRHPQHGSVHKNPDTAFPPLWPPPGLFSCRWDFTHLGAITPVSICPRVPAPWPPGNTRGHALGRKGVTDDVFLSEVVKHATIRSGLIVFLVIRSIY